jgi:prepilin-type N-terminal cleavage/methylation domain-containing protein
VAERRPPGGRLRAGFSLVEILLVLGLIAVLAVVSLLSFGPWREEAVFEEGVIRFESAIRLARAEAASRQIRLRLVFSDESGAQVFWEPDPLEQPGQFVPYVECAWADALSRDWVRVSRCQLTGDSAFRLLGPAGGGSTDSAETPMDPITFHTDGTSDSALVELCPAVEGDTRRAILQVSGTGSLIRTRMIALSQLAETYELIQAEENPPETAGG